MDLVIEFRPSAFKHSYTEQDIRHALKNKAYDAPLTDFPDKYGVVGFDAKWNLIEVLYNPIDDNTINVFHARKLQKGFLAGLDL
ncbi:hypothetical protein AGMMS49936_05210 [Endomicrobiia bacterium]|nr:hypothetical protein AGMMS49936_05210 [Endomicrobiia bacterium]